MGIEEVTSRIMKHVLIYVLIFIVSATNIYVTGDDDDTCTNIIACANCTAVRLCKPNGNGTYSLFEDFNCSGTAPYCDKDSASCQATPSLDCTVTGEFVCIQDGVFPHPTDCTKYFECVDLVSHTFQCTQNYYYYDSDTEECSLTTCENFNCNAESGIKVKYPRSSGIFAYCIDGVPVLIDRCPGRDELNETTQVCEPICRHEGLIPDTSNATNYYRCSYIRGGQLQMTKLSCPSGFSYNETEFQCMSTNSVLKKTFLVLN